MLVTLHYNDDNSYLFVNGKEIFKFKTDNENVNFPIQFCLGSISNGFSTAESREVSLNGNVYYFSVDCNSIDQSDILTLLGLGVLGLLGPGGGGFHPTTPPPPPPTKSFEWKNGTTIKLCKNNLQTFVSFLINYFSTTSKHQN